MSSKLFRQLTKHLQRGQPLATFRPPPEPVSPRDLLVLACCHPEFMRWRQAGPGREHARYVKGPDDYRARPSARTWVVRLADRCRSPGPRLDPYFDERFKGRILTDAEFAQRYQAGTL